MADGVNAGLQRRQIPGKASVLRTREEVERIRGEWSRLWESSEASPFQTPEWLLPWWDAFGPGELFVIAVRRGDQLAGLAPLYVEGGTARLIGSGNTDYLDVVAPPGSGPEVARTVFECLSGFRADLFDLPARSPLLGGDIERVPGEVCPVLHLPQDANELDVLPAARLRKGVRQYMRRFGERGAFRFEAAGEGRLEEYIEAFFDLHGARWESSGESGVLADSRVREFLRRALPGLWARGLLRLYGLRDEAGRLRGVQVALARGRRIFAYLAGYDPALEGFSPGTVMLRLAMEDAIRAGFSEWDFLRGGEPYKYDWGARDEQTWRVRVRAA